MHARMVCAIHSDGKKKETKLYGTQKQNGHEWDSHDPSDHSGWLQNHLWTKEEIDKELKSLYRHKPVSISDKIMNTLVSESVIESIILLQTHHKLVILFF